jgi:hypothetical protein
VHHFWTMTGGEAISARLESEEHLTVIGGLVIVSILSAVRREWKQRSEDRVSGVAFEQVNPRVREAA